MSVRLPLCSRTWSGAGPVCPQAVPAGEHLAAAREETVGSGPWPGPGTLTQSSQGPDVWGGWGGAPVL